MQQKNSFVVDWSQISGRKVVDRREKNAHNIVNQCIPRYAQNLKLMINLQSLHDVF